MKTSLKDFGNATMSGAAFVGNLARDAITMPFRVASQTLSLDNVGVQVALHVAAPVVIGAATPGPLGIKIASGYAAHLASYSVMTNAVIQTAHPDDRAELRSKAYPNALPIAEAPTTPAAAAVEPSTLKV